MKREDFLWVVVDNAGRELVHADTCVWGQNGQHFTWEQIKNLEVVDESEEGPEVCPENFYNNEFYYDEYSDGWQVDIGWGDEGGHTFATARPVRNK